MLFSKNAAKRVGSYTPAILFVTFLLAAPAHAAVGSGPKGLTGAKQVAAGYGFMCAINSSDNLVCWGNISGIPGDLGKIKSLAPARGFSDSFCAIRLDNSVRCWGGSDSLKSIPGNLGAVSQVAVGNGYACAVRSADSMLRCWGDVEVWDSQGSSRVQTFPVLSGLGAVSQISSASWGMCAVTKTNVAKCWESSGTDTFSATGIKQVLPSSSLFFVCLVNTSDVLTCRDIQADAGVAPLVPAALGKVSLAASGSDYACALTVSKTVRCFGALGYAGEVVAVPKGLGSSPPISALATARGSACSITASSALQCWGDNAYGQLDAVPHSNPYEPITSGSGSNSFTTDLTEWRWTNTPSSYTYQWKRSADGGKTWVNIAGANTIGYTAGALDKNKLIQLCITASNTNGSSMVCANRGAPRVVVGIQDSASRANGSIIESDTAISFIYQWQRWDATKKSWTIITGANTTSRVPDAADKAAGWIRFCAQGVSALGTGQLICSSPMGKETINPESSNSTSGISQEGSKLQFSSNYELSALADSSFNFYYSEDKPVGIPTTYQWQRAAPAIGDAAQTWSNIPGATSTSYTPVVADQGKDVRACVILTGSMGSLGPQCFQSYGRPSYNILAPVLEGSTLSVDVSGISNADNWSPELPIGAPTYKWYSSLTSTTKGDAISGATAASWTAPAQYKGKYITFCVTAANLLGSRDSCGTYGPPGLLEDPSIALSGKNLVTAVVTNPDDPYYTGWGYSDATTVTYKWQRAATATGPWVVIAGANKNTYTPVALDKGKFVRACITGSTSWGTGPERCSAARKN